MLRGLTFKVAKARFLYRLQHFNRRPGEESDANSSRGTSTDGESEGTDRGANDARGSWNQKNNIGHGFRRYPGRNNPSMESSVDGDDISNPPGLLIYEYFERELPFHREPLADKASLFSFLFHILQYTRNFFIYLKKGIYCLH